MTGYRSYVILILIAGMFVCLGLAAFPLGEYFAQRSNDPDGMASMLGFLMLIVFVGLGVSTAVAAIALWLFNLRDR